MLSNYRFDKTKLSLFLHFFWIWLNYRTTVKLIQVIIIYRVIYSSSIVLWSFSLLGLKHPSSYLFKPSSVDCWLVCIIFIGLELIDPETCPWVLLQIFSGLYPNWTYGLASPAGLCKVVAWAPIFNFHLSQWINLLASSKFLKLFKF